MSNEVERMFEPSMFGWMSLIPQRFRSSSGKGDEEFQERFQQMVAVRNELSKIEQAVTKWSSAMKKLYGAAKTLGKAVQTEDSLQKDAAWNGDILLKDDSALQNIREKITMINALIQQRTKLKYMKLKGEHAEYKLEQLRKKEASESFERLSQKYLTIKKESEKQREEIMAQILLVVNKYVSQANEHGVSDLIKPQLQAFKLSQFHMFLNCQKLIQGRQKDEGLRELEEHWTNFTSKIANEIPNQQAGGSFDGSAMFLKNKLGAAARDDIEDDEDDYDGDVDVEAKAPMKPTANATAAATPQKLTPNTGYRDSDFDGEDLTDLDSEPDKKDVDDSDDEDED